MFVKILIGMMNKWLWIGGAAVGAVAGFLYWQQIGCVSGTCPITSSPVVSTLYGSAMGFLVGGMFQPDKKSGEEE